MNDTPKCEICGEPMPPGETMFNFHGYSGPCPKPPLPKSRPKYSFGGVEGNDLKSLAAEIIKDNDPRALRDVCDEISAQLSKIVPDAPVAPERPAVPRPKPYA